MESIRHTKMARLGLLRMYREDLDQLVALFQQSCATFTLSDKRNRYDSLDEMKKHIGPVVIDLDVQGRDPGLHFILNNVEETTGDSSRQVFFNELRSEEITDAADSAFFRVREFLKEHETSSYRWQFIVIGFISFVCVILFMRSSSDDIVGGEKIIHAAPGWIISGIVLLFAIIGAMYKRTYVTLETRIDSPSFWLKNRERFATHVVTSAISGVVGYLIGHFLK